jgi:hypothetical protein
MRVAFSGVVKAWEEIFKSPLPWDEEINSDGESICEILFKELWCSIMLLKLLQNWVGSEVLVESL